MIGTVESLKLLEGIITIFGFLPMVFGACVALLLFRKTKSSEERLRKEEEEWAAKELKAARRAQNNGLTK